MPPGPHPLPPPVIAGTNVTVSLFLQNPPWVQRAITDLSLQRFVTDLIFSSGPAAEGGAVIYDQVTTSDLYLDRDVQEIEPGGEFPLLDKADVGPLVAIARKYGGEVMLYWEDIRRDRRGKLAKQMVRLRNTIVKKADTISMAALRAAPITQQVASGAWATPGTDIIADIVTASGSVDALDLGYATDTILVSPSGAQNLLKDKDIRDALPRERDDSLIRTGNIGRILGHDIVSTNRVVAGEVFVLQRKVVGGVSDEVPLYARPIEDDRRERTFIHGARVPAVYITDPKAAVRITGA